MGRDLGWAHVRNIGNKCSISLLQSKKLHTRYHFAVSDNCAITTEQCENGATCVNIEKVPGSIDMVRGYRCDCAAGWIDGNRAVCEVGE